MCVLCQVRRRPLHRIGRLPRSGDATAAAQARARGAAQERRYAAAAAANDEWQQRPPAGIRRGRRAVLLPQGHVAHPLACKYELLDTSVANPEWARDPPADVAVTEGKPPERSEYDLGEHGQKAYRRHRARWYREHTCKELTGSLEEQNEQWDNYKRNFRARGDSAPLERRHVIEPLWDDSE